jgi:hypothetical protein
MNDRKHNKLKALSRRRYFKFDFTKDIKNIFPDLKKFEQLLKNTPRRYDCKCEEVSKVKSFYIGGVYDPENAVTM